MAEAMQFHEDEASSYYFTQNAKRMQASGEIGELMKKHFKANFPNNVFKEMTGNYYDWCIRKLKKFSPDLKERIQAGLEEFSEQSKEYSNSNADNFDAPF